jgi:hypothetical protein
MKLGVKIGPVGWREVLQATQSQYCEVWYRLDWADRFIPIFKYLKAHSINFGLHFWAQLPGGFEPNLAWEADGIADHSQQVMLQTLDLAAGVGAAYVNVHPGSLRLKRLDLDAQTMGLVGEIGVTADRAWQSLDRRTSTLHQYGSSHGVLFLVETLPQNDVEHWRDDSGRLRPQPAQNLSPATILKLAQNGRWVTNDIGHTAASWVTGDPNQLWQNVYVTSQQLAPQTKLVHLNTVHPPFNGTDSHGGVLPQDFAAGVFPNRHQILQLLRLFKHRDDVWIIPEPPAPLMVQNYRAIQQLIQEI